ncbi:hypothetical protein GOBAR_DD04507 [Gossypium barbadense]|nr:hypothetical protein GOBAR_DD04507 [Gossypium barbadense]
MVRLGQNLTALGATGDPKGPYACNRPPPRASEQSRIQATPRRNLTHLDKRLLANKLLENKNSQNKPWRSREIRRWGRTEETEGGREEKGGCQYSRALASEGG